MGGGYVVTRYKGYKGYMGYIVTWLQGYMSYTIMKIRGLSLDRVTM
jgi:hypothetical protein